MEHLMYSHRKHPPNDQALGVKKANTKKNRKDALAGIPKKTGFARDEKPPNILVRPTGNKGVTVRYVSTDESELEKNLMRTATTRARAKNIKVQLHANPSPDYNGRGGRSLSRPGSPDPAPGRSQTPNPETAGPSHRKAKDLEPSRPGRTASGSPASPARGRSSTRKVTDGTSHSSESSPKPAWNAGPGARSRSPNGSQRAGSTPPSPGGESKSQSRSSKARGKQPVWNFSPQGGSPSRNASPQGGAPSSRNVRPQGRPPAPQPPAQRRSGRLAAKKNK